LVGFKRFFHWESEYFNSSTKIAGNPPKLIWFEYLRLI
jgi:hypothetical protein